MKKIIPILLLIFLLTSCASIGSGVKPQNASTLHNTILGKDVYLGESKDQIDKDLGPSISGKIYAYTDVGLSVWYTEGKAVMFIVSDKQWSALNGIRLESSLDDVTKAYGTLYKGNIALFDKDSKPTSNKDDAKIFIILQIADNKVTGMTVTQNLK